MNAPQGVGFCSSASLLLALAPLLAGADDYFRWRGPSLNGLSKETGWATRWPASGPKQLWKVNVGTGFSSVTVASGRAYTMGNKKDEDTVYCFDAATGAPVWKQSYAEDLMAKYYDGGTSASPTIDGNRVYTLSKKAKLYCFDAAKGDVIWNKDLVAETGAKVPTWGFASSPVVEGDWLLLNVGTAGMAVEKATGKIVWKSGPGEAGYSSAVPYEVDGQRHMLLFLTKSVASIRIKDGAVLWQHPWETSYDVNAADPILQGDEMFISSGYNRGCALLKVTGSKPSVVWENKVMRTHFNPCLLIGEHVYGIDGDAGSDSAQLKCVEWATGKVKWAEKTGFGAVAAADGKLIVLNHQGKLSVADASPAGYKALSTAQVVGGKCWTTPTLANGRLYCRTAQGDVVCLDVKQ